MTIAFTLFKGFPKLKAVRYIIAQILGAYVASVLVYYQWRPLIQEAEALLLKAGKYDALMFTPSGPAGIFALYLPTGQTMGTAFLNEFVNVSLILIPEFYFHLSNHILVCSPRNYCLVGS